MRINAVLIATVCLLLLLFIFFYFAFQNDVIMERDNIVSVTLQSMDDNSATFNWKRM